VLLTTSCRRGDQAPNLDATVASPHQDTVRFSVSATTHRCTDGRAMLLEAVSPEGNGVLVRLQYRDSLVNATYPVVVPGDTTAPGAVVAVRYLLRDVTHAFFFDTGAVEVHRERKALSGRADGSGIENAVRTHTHFQYHDVPLPAHTDTVPCSFRP
jgi:hypothetical protein